MCGAFRALEEETIAHTYTYCTWMKDGSTTAAGITSVRTSFCLDHPTTEEEICYSAQMLQQLATFNATARTSEDAILVDSQGM